MTSLFLCKMTLYAPSMLAYKVLQKWLFATLHARKIDFCCLFRLELRLLSRRSKRYLQDGIL